MGYYGRVFALTVSSHCLPPHNPLACLDTGRSPEKALTRSWQYGTEITRNELTLFINLHITGIQSQQQKESGVVARPRLQSPALGKTRQGGVMISRLAWTTYWDPVSRSKPKQTRVKMKDRQEKTKTNNFDVGDWKQCLRLSSGFALNGNVR